MRRLGPLHSDRPGVRTIIDPPCLAQRCRLLRRRGRARPSTVAIGGDTVGVVGRRMRTIARLGRRRVLLGVGVGPSNVDRCRFVVAAELLEELVLVGAHTPPFESGSDGL